VHLAAVSAISRHINRPIPLICALLRFCVRVEDSSKSFIICNTSRHSSLAFYCRDNRKFEDFLSFICEPS
jgi:hypothetical protein